MDRLQEYTPLQVLGSGAHGRAILARHTPTDSERVVKLVNLTSLTPHQAAQANNEAVLLARLRHPSVVRHYESFTVNKRLCIVTEYARGGDLRQLLRSLRNQHEALSSPSNYVPGLPARDVLHVFFQLVDALAYLHAQRIVHRDVKGDNVFVVDAAKLTVRLGDFGVSRELATDETKASTAVGTPFYLSPELVQRLPYDAKTDMWALGCLLYELATLHHAFAAPSFTALCDAIVNARVRPVDNEAAMHPFVLFLIRRLLQREPASRPSAKRVLHWRERLEAPSPSLSVAPSPQDDIKAKLVPIVAALRSASSPLSESASSDLLFLRVQLERLFGLRSFHLLQQEPTQTQLQEVAVSAGVPLTDLVKFYVPIVQDYRTWRCCKTKCRNRENK